MERQRLQRLPRADRDQHIHILSVFTQPKFPVRGQHVDDEVQCGNLVACEKTAIEDGIGNRLSIGEGRSVRDGVSLGVGCDEDVSDAAR